MRSTLHAPPGANFSSLAWNNRTQRPEMAALEVRLVATPLRFLFAGLSRLHRRLSLSAQTPQPPLASSISLQDGAQTAWARPSSLRVFIKERVLCLPHK